MTTLLAPDSTTRRPQSKEESPDTAETAIELKIEDAVGKFRRRLNDPLLSKITREQYETMIEELVRSRNLQYIEDNITFLIRTLAVARNYQESFFRDIDVAQRKKWISAESALQWKRRFNDPDLLEFERKKWITDTKSDSAFPAMLARWEAVAQTRDQAEALAKKLQIDRTMQRELADVLNVDVFCKMHFLERQNKAHAAYAELLAMDKQRTSDFQQARGLLRDASKPGSYMHPAKVGKWLRRVMESKDPSVYIEEVLIPCMERWRAVYEEFQRIQAATDTEHAPRGWKPIKREAFLLMNYRKRTSYCALAWIQLQDQDTAPEDMQYLAGLKLAIRKHFNAEDWTEAKEQLNRAQAAFPDDPEILSMREYAEAHATEEESDNTPPHVLLEDMRGLVGQISNNDVQMLFHRALEQGPAVFNRLSQVWSNRVWMRDFGGWDEAEEQRQTQSSRNSPNGYVLDMEQQGSATILQQIASHADENAGSGDTNLSTNERWGYWATLIPPLPFAEHRRIYSDSMWKLKTMLRSLHKQGYGYTPYGDLKSYN